MAGLLDFYGDPQANMALAAGLLSGGNFGQAMGRGIAGAQAVQTAEEERKRRNELAKAQEENWRSEAAARVAAMEKQKWAQALAAQYLGGGGGQSGPVAGDAYMPGAPQSQQQAPQQAGGGNLFDPRTLAALKISGVDLTDVAKLAQPNWQNVNGNMVNTNDPAFRGGFQPGMQVSANGQATMWQPDGKGGLVMGAPAGALDTYAAYQNVGKRAENQNTLAPLDRINPATGRPYAATVDSLVQQVNGVDAPQRPASAGERGMREQVSGGNGNTQADYAREIQQTQASLQNPNLDPASRKMLEQHLAQTVSDSQRAAPNGVRSSVDPRRVDNPSGFSGFAGPSEIAGATAKAETGVKLGAERIMTGYDNARTAAESLITNNEARKSIAGGIFVGTGAETKLSISKALGGMGFHVAPELTTNTDYLQSTLGQAILNRAKTLGTNPTDRDAEIIKTIVGSIGKDPGALNKLLDYQDMMAGRAIDNHNKTYGAAKKGGFDAGYDLTIEKPSFNAPGKPQKVSLADIAETARRSGKTTAEVTAAMRAKGYEIGGN